MKAAMCTRVNKNDWRTPCVAKQILTLVLSRFMPKIACILGLKLLAYIHHAFQGMLKQNRHLVQDRHQRQKPEIRQDMLGKKPTKKNVYASSYLFPRPQHSGGRGGGVGGIAIRDAGVLSPADPSQVRNIRVDFLRMNEERHTQRK